MNSQRKAAYLFLLMLPMLFASAQAQNITASGVVRDSSDHSPLVGANIILRNIADTTDMAYGTTDADGKFRIDHLQARQYHLTISYIGYRKYHKIVAITRKGRTFGVIYMAIQPAMMKDVHVVGRAIASVQKGDTVQYNANAFKTNPDASAQDLVRKMPGITVQNGTLQAQGENVQKVLVDGKEFFGDDPETALNNLPADAIDKIEVFDKKSDQAQFTGFDDGNTQKTLNIVTKKDKRHSQFGRVYAGYGTNTRNAEGGNINFFNGDQRVSIIGMSNNVNQQNFSTQDLLGVVGNSSQRDRRRGRNRAASNFLVGQQNGITTTHSFGINYNDHWGKKVDVNGSYFFNTTGNKNEQTLNRTYFLTGDVSQYYDENNYSNSDNYNHRLNMRINYNIDEHNRLLITPNLSFQKYNSTSNLLGTTVSARDVRLNQSTNNYSNKSFGYDFSNNLLFRHSFDKRGRTISVRVRNGANRDDGSNYQHAFNTYYQPSQTDLSDTLNQHPKQLSNGYSVDGRLSYTEPIGSNNQLEISYDASYNKSNSDKRMLNFDPFLQQYAILDTALSNKFNSGYLTNEGELSFRHRTRKVMAMAGLSYQRSDLSSDETYPGEFRISRSFINLLPHAVLRVRFSDNTNFRLYYRGDIDAPSINQLQEVVNNTNPLLLSTGNPDLKQEYSHRIVMRFSHNNIDKSSNFFAFIRLQKTMDYIGSETIIAGHDTTLSNNIVLNQGSQLTRPQNMSGYWNARTFLNYGFPVHFIRSNLNLHTSISFSRTPGIINQTKNFSNSYSFGQGLVIGSNISEKVDFTISGDVNYNIVQNSIQPRLNNHYMLESVGVRFKWNIWKGIVWGNDVSQQSYRGLGDTYNQNYILWNMSLGKKFLEGQRAEASVAVFDLLNQNSSISRNVTDTYIEDQQTQILHRYFLFSLSYRI